MRLEMTKQEGKEKEENKDYFVLLVSTKRRREFEFIDISIEE
jgi:hypothetical protein